MHKRGALGAVVGVALWVPASAAAQVPPGGVDEGAAQAWQPPPSEAPAGSAAAASVDEPVDRTAPHLRGGLGAHFGWYWSDRDLSMEDTCFPEEGCHYHSPPSIPRTGFAASADLRIGVGFNEHVGVLYDGAFLFGMSWVQSEGGNSEMEIGMRNGLLLALSPSDRFELALGPSIDFVTGFELLMFGPQLRLTTMLTELDDYGGGASLAADIHPSFDLDGQVIVTMTLGVGYDWL